MLRKLLVFVFLFSLAGLYAGTELSFKVMTPPLKEGERLLLLGNFNNWEGDAYELAKLPGTQIYYRSFVLDVRKKDTLEYKFAIRRPDGSLYWEKNPNPANPHSGNRFVIIGGKWKKTVIPPAFFRYDAYFRYPVILSPADMQSDFLQMRQILEEVHPALYDYTPREVMDSVFDYSAGVLGEPAFFREYYNLLSYVVAQVGCGHSSMWIPREYWEVAPPFMFPLELQIDDSLVLVRGNLDDRSVIPEGSRLLSINGLPVSFIVEELEALTSADGMNPAYKKAMVEKNFSQKLAMRFGFPQLFKVQYIPYGKERAETAFINPVSREVVQAAKPLMNERSLRIDGKVAILTLNTFAYYGKVDEFRIFMDSTFGLIREEGLDRLIIDLRGNNGGDPYCAAVLLSYLEDRPVPYFEKGNDHYDTLAIPVPVSDLSFSGKFYTLIDGRGFSTTGHFCSLLKYNGFGEFVGSELGATYTCTGNAMYPALDQTGIMLGTAKVRRYTAAVEGLDPRQGIMPDYPVQCTADDLAEGRDAVMEFALQLARK